MIAYKDPRTGETGIRSREKRGLVRCWRTTVRFVLPGSPAARTALTGSLLALAATAAWSGNFIAAKMLSPHLSASAMDFWRWAVASLCMAPLGLGPLLRHRHEIRRHIKALALYGLIGMSLANMLYYKAPETASAVNMVILAAVAPLFMMVYARILFGEPITGRRLAGSCLALFGVAALVTKGQWGELARMRLTPGDFWTLGGAACFALYSVSLRYFKGTLPIRAFLLVIFLFGVLWTLPIYLWDSWGHFAMPFLDAAMAPGLIYIGCGASCVAFLCWNAAIARIGAVKAGIIYYLLPVFGAAGAVWLLGERLAVAQLTGGALVLGGVLLSSLPGRRVFRPCRRFPTDRADS